MGLGIAGLGAYGASQQGGGFMNWLSGGK